MSPIKKPAQGGHFDRSHQELLLGFNFLGGNGLSFSFFGRCGFSLLGGSGGGALFLGQGRWLDCCFWRRGGMRCRHCCHGMRCRLGWDCCGRCLGVGAGSKETSDQGSEEFVHLEFLE
ncbi:MAG: hypothetical protein M3R45_14420 [Pseudomonadota bacterium]|nr:hypothetical protein [Pseudomonadota bacterium]